MIQEMIRFMPIAIMVVLAYFVLRGLGQYYVIVGIIGVFLAWIFLFTRPICWGETK